MTDKTFHEKLVELQHRVKLGKNSTATVKTKAGGEYTFPFRNAEQILRVANPILHELGLTIRMSDKPVYVGDKYFIMSIAIVSDGTEMFEAEGTAELLEAAQMNESQAAGATSSYSRKYALGGLLGLDDGKDADALADEIQPRSYSGSSTKAASAKQVGFAESLLSKSDKDAARSWFKDHFGNKPLSELTSKECSEFIEYLNNKPAGTIDDVSQYSDEVF